MTDTIHQQLKLCQRLPSKELRQRYAELFGDEPRTWNRTWLFRRLAWRLQCLAEGGLSERAKKRAAELANDADLRLTPPRPRVEPIPTFQVDHPVAEVDERLPPVGAILTRTYKGARIQVQILGHGFAYDGAIYKSLSAVAKAVTGSHCNGFLFFKLNTKTETA